MLIVFLFRVVRLQVVLLLLTLFATLSLLQVAIIAMFDSVLMGSCSSAMDNDDGGGDAILDDGGAVG